MARRKRNNRRRRRGSFVSLYKLLCLVLIVGAIVAAMAVFFKTEQVVVTGNVRYADEEIAAACGVKTGDNLFFMNKYDVAGHITDALPYIESVSINRELPSRLHIHVRECACGVTMEQDGQIWLLCQVGKIVDAVSELPGTGAVVTGLALEKPAVGQPMAAAEGNDRALAQLRQLLDHLRSKGMLSDVQEIHLEHEEYISIRYLDRFDVELPWNADLDYKLNFLAAVVAKLEDYETGTLKMMTDGEARLIS